METGPPKKPFWMVSFIIHATRGLLRDEGSRRKTMGISLLAALLMVVAGLTILRSWLEPHEHPWRFIFFWLACAWATLLGLFLALLDLLLIRAQARAARKLVREKLSKGGTSEPSIKST
jgi:hypothetical protein